MQCPRCRQPITVAPDPGGFLICPGCGARLTARPARPPQRGADNPNATLPPGTPLKKIPRPGEDTAKSGNRGPSTADGVGQAPAPSPRATPAEAPSAAAPAASATPAAPAVPATLEAVLAELKALRAGQEEILLLLRVQAGPDHVEAREEDEDELSDEDMAALLPPVRSRQRKTVLVIDDDAETRENSVAELQAADVPVRAFADGRTAFESMAREKPDVIALELDLGGTLSGKDVINMIKATMEWVDIPIILYTRAPVESQREARQVHGADDVVLKRSGSAALVSKVIAHFRRP